MIVAGWIVELNKHPYVRFTVHLIYLPSLFSFHTFSINECANEPCLNGGMCIDGINGFTCTCLDGFLGTTCELDRNECATNNGNCEQICTNTVGSHICSCESGYALNANGQTCDDIEECAVNNGGCDHICTNTQGGHVCSCNSGYSLDADGLTCLDNDECAANNGGCSQICTNTAGGHACSCNSGYSLDADGLTCIEITASPTSSPVAA